MLIRNLSILFLLLGFTTIHSNNIFAQETNEDELPFVRILMCKQVSKCDTNDICKIEVFVSFNDWSEKKTTSSADASIPSSAGASIPMKGILTWEQAEISDTDKNWVSHDKLAMPAQITLSSSKDGDSFEIKNLINYPEKTTLIAKNTKVGSVTKGILIFGNKSMNYSCKRFKDPK